MPHDHAVHSALGPLSDTAAQVGLAPSLGLALLAMFSLWAGASLPGWGALRARGLEKHLALLIGFSAGLMPATSLHDLLPEALEKNPSGAMTGVAIGFLTLYVIERATHFHACRRQQCSAPHEHSHDEHTHEIHGAHGVSAHGAHFHGFYGSGSVREHADTMALAGMSVHNFADGLTTAVAFSVSPAAGLTVILAIVLHQVAAGLSLGAMMMRAGRARQRALVSTLGAGAAIPLGVLFYHFAVPLDVPAQGVLLGVAGGSFLYVAACDLLPEAHAEDQGWCITAATIAGYAFTLLARALSSHAH